MRPEVSGVLLVGLNAPLISLDYLSHLPTAARGLLVLQREQSSADAAALGRVRQLAGKILI
jgi:hypothetical protein